jgi:hypothetical protein
LSCSRFEEQQPLLFEVPLLFEEQQDTDGFSLILALERVLSVIKGELGTDCHS